MADVKQYLVHEQENGKILISEEVVASIAAIAIREVEGVYGLSLSSSFELSSILGKKNLNQGIHVELGQDGMVISCNLIVNLGSTVLTVAKNVQEAINEAVISMTGEEPAKVNVNVCGVAMPKN